MKLITASRLSPEKGIDRLIKLANILNDNNIPFSWDVYGNDNTSHAKRYIIQFPENVNFKGFDTEVVSKMKNYDYLVQLSDTEGYCYVIIEALSQKLPCIITDFPSGKEQITDGVNGHVLDMDLSNWKKILKPLPKLKKYKELSSVKDWIDLIES